MKSVATALFPCLMMLFSANVSAEYYLVGQCGCPHPRIIHRHRCLPKHRVKKVRKRRVKNWHCHYRVRRVIVRPCYHERFSCLACVHASPYPDTPSYNPCAGRRVIDSAGCLASQYSHDHLVYPRSEYYYQPYSYNPDRITGDDDPSIYPDMNIDR